MKKFSPPYPIFLYFGYFFVAMQPNLSPSPLTVEFSRSHTFGILWTSDQLVAEAATYKTHNKHKIHAHSGTFLSLSLSLSLSLCTLSVLCPGFCLFSVLHNTHTQYKHPCPWRDFLFSFTVFVLHLCLVPYLDCPAFCLLSLLITHNTNIHAPGEIRTRNSSK